MNAMPNMKDPAAGVAPALIPHLHLLSKYRYPLINNPSLETIVGYLLEAPKIVRELQPMQWQYLDGPSDGTLMLTWQPLEYLGTNFASDGYVYADAEQVFKSEVRGYTLEMFWHRSGYLAKGEAVAGHSRRRYRLLPGPGGPANTDPSLFLIHYSKAQQRDHVPAASIPLIPYIQSQIQQRRQIQASGQLARKEFMLNDRANWPTINVPQGVPRPGQPGQMVPVAVAGHRRGPSLVSAEATLEEEEDVSRGDILDFMTPRDLSKMRYEQHHEWMEEILETPYNVSQIIPGDLGLGRKGDLEHLTKDFFDTPTSILRETNGNTQTTRPEKLPAGKAEEFTKRAEEKIASMQAELEKMRERHSRRLERLRRTNSLLTAERKLRNTSNTSGGRSMSNGASGSEPLDPIDEIVGQIESTLDKKVGKLTAVNCISKGGLEERYIDKVQPNKNSNPKPVSSPEKTDHERIMQGDNAQQTAQNNEQTSQPDTTSQQVGEEDTMKSPEKPTLADNAEAQPTSMDDDDDVLFGDDSGDQGIDMGDDMNDEGDQQNPDMPELDDLGMDVDMSEMVEDEPDEAGDDLGGASEWVMVGDQDEPGNTAGTPDQQDQENHEQQEQQNNLTQQENANQQQDVSRDQPSHSNQPVQQNTAQQEPSQGEQDQQEPDLDTHEFDMGPDFDNVDVDTAGDALASYGDDDDNNLGLGDMDSMDDSAFGDAFHHDNDNLS